MSTYSYTSTPDGSPPLGLVVLQSDETIEHDMRRLLGANAPYVSRVPSAPVVTAQTLQSMEAHIAASAALLPAAQAFGAVGYGCTSGTAQIGAARIEALVKTGITTAHVTNPLSALVAACTELSLKRLAFVSPYVAEVSDTLRSALRAQNIESPSFGSFDEAQEEKVVRIDNASISKAARGVYAQGPVDGIFLSCTNLRTLDVIAPLEEELGVPVLSSNLVLGWHMAKLAGVGITGPGRLLA